MLFSHNGPLSGVSHTLNTAPITVDVDGYYQIDYSVSKRVGAQSAIALAINDVVDASTNIAALAGVGEISGTVILLLNSGDEITLRNNSAFSFTMDVSPSVGAQITLILLG